MKKNEKDIGIIATSIFSSLLGGKFIGTAITLLVYVIVARFLGPANYGVYTIAFGFSNLVVGAFGAFGVGAYFNAYLAKHVYNRERDNVDTVISNGYLILTPIAIILTIISVAISGYVATNTLADHADAIYLIVASFSIFFATLKSGSELALVGFGRGRLAAVSLVSTAVVQLVTIIALIHLGYGIMGAVAGMLAGFFVGFWISLYLVLRMWKMHGSGRFVWPAKAKLKAALRFAAPIGVNNFLNTGIINFSTLFIGFYLATTFVTGDTGKTLLGNYGLAINGFALIGIFYGTMTNVLIQTFSTARTAHKERAPYGTILRYSLIITLPLLVYVGVLAAPVVHILFSSKYTVAPLYFSLIVLGLFINIIGIYLVSLLAAGDHTIAIMKYAVISGAAQLASLFVLVHYYGIIGGIIALFFIGSVVDDYLLIRGASRLMKMKFEYKKLIALFASNAILALPIAAALALHSGILQLVVGFVILVLVYPILMAVSRSINADDLDKIQKATSKEYGINTLARYLTGYARIWVNVLGG